MTDYGMTACQSGLMIWAESLSHWKKSGRFLNTCQRSDRRRQGEERERFITGQQYPVSPVVEGQKNQLVKLEPILVVVRRPRTLWPKAATPAHDFSGGMHRTKA